MVKVIGFRTQLKHVVNHEKYHYVLKLGTMLTDTNR